MCEIAEVEGTRWRSFPSCWVKSGSRRWRDRNMKIFGSARFVRVEREVLV